MWLRFQMIEHSHTVGADDARRRLLDSLPVTVWLPPSSSLSLRLHISAAYNPEKSECKT